MKYRGPHSEAKTGGSRGPGALARENQMIGEKVDETAQATAEGTMWGKSAAEDAHGPSSLGDFQSIAPRTRLTHH